MNLPIVLCLLFVASVTSGPIRITANPDHDPESLPPPQTLALTLADPNHDSSRDKTLDDRDDKDSTLASAFMNPPVPKFDVAFAGPFAV